MSILALAIGLTMVATLFPAAILRSINATRLTRGTIHRYNAEAWIDVFTDQLVHNPDLSGQPLPNGNPVFSPRKHYDVNNLPAQGGYTGNNYIVDPIGWELIRRDSPANANYFGDPIATFGTGRLERYNGLNNRLLPLTAAQFATALQVAASPDSWVEPLKGEFTVTATTAAAPGGTVTITGPSTGDLQSLSDQLGGTEPPEMRVVILDADAKFSHSRRITAIAPATGVITWSAGGPLPAAGFTAATARIQTQERQFTWLLTVRNRTELGAGPASDIKKANVDVVVFFRRQYSTNYENTAWRFVSAGARRFRVEPPTGGPLPAATVPARPFLKRGAWLCDTMNARWFRIQRIDQESSNTPYVVLETAHPAGSLTLMNASSENYFRGVILPTVVEVYPLGTKQ